MPLPLDASFKNVGLRIINDLSNPQIYRCGIDPRTYRRNGESFTIPLRPDERRFLEIVPSTATRQEYIDFCRQYGVSVEIFTIRAGAPQLPELPFNLNYTLITFPEVWQSYKHLTKAFKNLTNALR